jgi:hypothetical protein
LCLCPAKFQENALHLSTGMCAAMVKDISGHFKTGEVYPSKIEVNLQQAKISFGVVSRDSCNGVDPSISMKGQVVFQIPKEYLKKADAGTVENAIGQAFSIGNDTQAQSNQPQGQQEQAQQGQARQEQPAEQEQAQPDPQTIQGGQSTHEVQAALGKAGKDCEPRSQAALRVQGSEDHICKRERFGGAVSDEESSTIACTRGATPAAGLRN